MSDVCIFISHRYIDSKRAESWAKFLNSRGVECYLDTLDPVPQKLNGQQVSKYLHEQLRRCSHLLVIFTDNTSGSMWVPFEIGIATERDIGIAIDQDTSDNSLPEYLLEWPILKRHSHYDAFVNQVKQTPMIRGIYKSYNLRYSDRFHETLKAEISKT